MKGRPREFDREQALYDAMRLFWKKGYESTSIGDLTDQMGIGRQSLYSTFGDKKSLYLESLRAYCQTQFAQMESILGAPGSPLENLKKLYFWVGEQVVSPDFQGCLVANSMGELGDRDEEIATLLQSQVRRLRQILHKALERAAEAGELPESADPECLSAVMLSSFFGMTLLGKMGANQEILNDSIRSTLCLLE